MARKRKGPSFTRWFPYVLQALKALDGGARPPVVYETVARLANVAEEELDRRNKNGGSWFENQVAWARFHLVKAGFIDDTKYGVWVLTDLGRRTDPKDLDVLAAYDRARNNITGLDGTVIDSTPQVEVENFDQVAPDTSSRYINESATIEQLVLLVQSISDKGFENLCAHLLKSEGFIDVDVVGRSGDAGIDGGGWMQLNRFVRTKVFYQAKRYTGTVGPEQIRSFRGAMHARGDRGLFFTSGTFTRGAIAEASRDAAVPIELFDGFQIAKILIEMQIGVSETKALKIEERFFDQYKD